MPPSNQFDSANYPQREPDELIVGDRWAWKRTDLSNYDNTLYTLKYSLRLEASFATKIEITADPSGASDYLVEVPSATTVAKPAGRYHWQAYMIRIADSERITLNSGTLNLIVDTEASAADPRTHARKVLDAIEAYLEDSNNLQAASYSLAGRSLDRIPLADLIVFRDKYRREVISEENASRIGRGLPGRNVIKVRL